MRRKADKRQKSVPKMQKAAPKTEKPKQRSRFLPGLYVLLIASLLLVLYLAIIEYLPDYGEYAAVILQFIKTTALSLMQRVGLPGIIGSAVALIVLLLAFFLPTKHKKKPQIAKTEQKHAKLKNISIEKHFGHGWQAFAAEHFKASHTNQEKPSTLHLPLFKKSDKKVRAFSITIGAYETGIDALYNEVLKRGKVTLEEIQATFKISKDLAEEWARILEAKQLVSIGYPAFGSMVLTTPKKEKEDEL